MYHTTDNTTTILDQVRGYAKNPIASALGATLGAIIPLVTYHVTHYQAPANPWLYILVAAGLLYSAPKVYDWARTLFGTPIAGVAFTIIMEMAMVVTDAPVTKYAGLVVLVVINALSVAYNITDQDKRAKLARRHHQRARRTASAASDTLALVAPIKPKRQRKTA